ncbi:MAG: transaldolase [Alphaproteobacteria bacterium]|nr:transaldolase [Alphaproteobacteria bacterium]
MITATALDLLTVKIFADGAERETMVRLAGNPLIQGFTTNPTLMRKAGVLDYKRFALDLIEAIPDRPISFEVFADDLPEMAAQAREIASWGPNVNVKIPVTNTRGESCVPVINELSEAGVVVNVTAVFTLNQVRDVTAALAADVPAIVSVFAGRIADTGVDPMGHMRAAADLMMARPLAELLWASPRELLNIFHADSVGCHIITVTQDLLDKLPNVGKDLREYSMDTVKMFYEDARSAGYAIETELSLTNA